MKSAIPLICTVVLCSCKSIMPGSSVMSELESGVASWYGPGFDGKKTANGEIFNTNALTAAHRTLPFNTHVKVVNQDNGKEVMVRINDRGPYAKDRIIDLSKAAAKRLDMIEAGTAAVSLFVPLSLKNNLGIADLKSPTFSVQIASFSSSKDASTEAKRFADGWVQEKEIKGKVVFRVLVGTYSSESEAILRKSNLSRQGISGFVKQIEN